MTENSVPAAGTDKPAASVDANPTNQVPNQQTSSDERIAALIEQAIQKKLDPFQATLTRVKKTLEDREPKQSSAEKTLTERIASLEADKQRFAARKRSAAILDAGREAGIPPSRLKAFAALVETDAGNRIGYDDEHDAAHWTDDLEQRKPLAEFVSGFLKSEAGEMFKPATAVPAGRGLRTTGQPATSTTVRQVTRDDLAKGRVSPSEIRQGKAELID